MPTAEELFPDTPAAASAAPTALPAADELFPDKPQLLAGMQQHLATAPATRPEGTAAWLKREATYAADQGIRGLLGLGGLPGTLDEAAGRQIFGQGYHSLLPTGEGLDAALTRGEAASPHPVRPGDIAPQNADDRYLGAVARGAGAAPAAMLLGVPPGIAAASSLGGAVGSQMGQDVAGPAGALAGGVVGGGMGQGLASAIGRQSLGKVAAKLGSSTSLQEAGTELQGHVSDWMKNTLPEWQRQVWAPVDAKIPASLPVPIPAFRSALKQLQTSSGALQGVSNALTPGLANKLAGAVGRTSATPSWQDVSALRSQVGEMISSPQLRKDLSDQQVSKLYAGLSSDMRTAAHGAGAGPEFDEANTNSSALFRLADPKGPVGKVLNDADLSKNTLRPGDIATNLLNGAKRDSSTLDQLRMIAPQGVDELAAAHLRQPSVSFHRLPEESQLALAGSPLLQQQAMRASKQAAGESTKEALASPLHALVGENLGEGLGTLAGHLAGYAQNSLLPPEAGRLLGLTAPYAWKALRGGALHPERMQGAGLGLALGLQPQGKAANP